MPVKTITQKYILWFRDISAKDVPLVGGKNASLGEMKRNLSLKGINIPDGFALNAKSYRYFIEKNQLKDRIKKILKDLDIGNIRDLKKKGKEIRDSILKGQFPADLLKEIRVAYQKICKEYGENTGVA